MTEIRDYFRPMPDDGQIHAMSSLALAHVGDAVYGLLVRLWCSAQGGERADRLHSSAVAMVNAAAQARAVQRIQPLLTPEEAEVYRRGRNAKVHSVPRNARRSEYHEATGLEALLGYLYLKGRTERINTLFACIVEEPHAD